MSTYLFLGTKRGGGGVKCTLMGVFRNVEGLFLYYKKLRPKKLLKESPQHPVFPGGHPSKY